MGGINGVKGLCVTLLHACSYRKVLMMARTRNLPGKEVNITETGLKFLI